MHPLVLDPPSVITSSNEIHGKAKQLWEAVQNIGSILVD